MAASVALLPDRLLEQTEPWTSWDRRAWEPGTVLQLRELCEAAKWAERGVLSSTAVTWLQRNLLPLIGQDRGLAEGAVRSQLERLLKHDRLEYGSQKLRRLEHLIEFIAVHYLKRWRDTLAASSVDINVERASRFISSHVVDAGFHPDWLRRQIRGLVKDGAAAADIVDQFLTLMTHPAETFDGFVAFEDVPEIALMQALPEWLPPEEVARRLKVFPAATGVRQVGGLAFSVQARDVRSAVAEIADRLDRLASRTRFLRSSKTLQYHRTFYAADGASHTLDTGMKQINVMALQRMGVLYSASLTDEQANAVDDALELASHLMRGPASVAAAGAWAALESLLVTGTDSSMRETGRAIAADRAAALITASWPRAELTRLSHRITTSAGNDPRLVAQLSAAGDENAERSAVMLDWLKNGRVVTLLEPRDRAAKARMDALIDDPKSVLGRVRRYMTGSFRRLYRQRNLVLHGGAARPVALAASIRTSGPLVGAALDRVSYAFELHHMSPLDAVARAECALAAVADDTGWPLHDLAAG